MRYPYIGDSAIFSIFSLSQCSFLSTGLIRKCFMIITLIAIIIIIIIFFITIVDKPQQSTCTI